MNNMVNDLDRPFKISNMRYGREAREISKDISIYIEREERDLGYGAIHSTDCVCVMDQFFIFKVQMIDPTIQNDFRMKIT
jgi:hypothetical protein